MLGTESRLVMCKASTPPPTISLTLEYVSFIDLVLVFVLVFKSGQNLPGSFTSAHHWGFSRRNPMPGGERGEQAQGGPACRVRERGSILGAASKNRGQGKQTNETATLRPSSVTPSG